MFGAFKGQTRTFKNGLPFLILEIVLIFLSVLLAFSMGQWQERINENERAELALLNIKTEIQKNRYEVEPLIEIHKNLIARTYEIPDSISQNNSAWDIFLYALDGENPHLPWVERSAWDAAVFSGAIQNMDFELLANISSLYNLQGKGIDALFDQFSDLMFMPTFYDPDQAAEHLITLQQLMQSIYGNEISYLSSCDHLLAQMEKY